MPATHADARPRADDPLAALAAGISRPSQEDHQLALAWSRARELGVALMETQEELARERRRRLQLERRIAAFEDGSLS